jgi:phosphoenolpyruvate phosphomutase / 2-hydroxyethylphosphonate cytidylyltransferase
MKKGYFGMSVDFVHQEHLNIQNKAAELAQVVVGVLTESAIASHTRLPYMNYEQRADIVNNLKALFEVISQSTLDYSENLKALKPDYVVHVDDWKDGVQQKTLQILANSPIYKYN